MKDKKNKKVLITGAGGYIGSHATDVFLGEGYEVVALDNFSAGFQEPLEILQKEYGKDKLRFYNYDLTSTNLSEIFEKEQGISAVIHFAGVASVDESMKNPFKYFFNNFYGSVNLIDTMIKFGITKIVFSSTCVTYGDAQYMPVDENHPQKPENPYGESKLMVEKAIEWYSRLKGLKYVIFRYFNVSGCHEEGKLGDSQRPSIRLVQNAVRGALGLNEFYLTCNKVDTPDGTPIRDIIHVMDLVDAHVLAVDYLDKDGSENQKINLGTGNGDSVMEIVKYTQEITGTKFDITIGNSREGEYARMVSSIDKAKKVLGWSPKRTMRDTVESLTKWYKIRPDGWTH